MDEILTRRYLYPELPVIIKDIKPFVLATVVETTGSSPQIPGSSAIIGLNGVISGTVGGGMTEFTVTKKAQESIKNGKSTYYKFDLDEDISDPDAVICGGGMGILIDAAPTKHEPVFKALSKSYRERIPGVLITMIKNSSLKGLEIFREWLPVNKQEKNLDKYSKDVSRQLKHMLYNPRFGDFHFTSSTSVKNEGAGRIIIESIVPLPRLIIAGAGHVGKALSHLGKLLDFEVIVWDDREEYANEMNLSDASRVFSGDLKHTLGKIKAEKDTFVVIVTRGHKNDSNVLRMFIGSDAGYIGMIGSSKKVGQVRKQFLDHGWANSEQWKRIYTPVGLKIHSKTIQEIAFSIAAQLIKVRYEINQ